MDKFISTGIGGLPLTLNDIRYFLGQLSNQGIYQALNAMLRGFGTDFIIEGVTESGGNVTEGFILLNGEILRVDAHNRGANTHFIKVTTFDSAGDKTFLNGSNQSTYQQNRAVVNATSGTLKFDGDRIKDTIDNIATNTSDISDLSVLNFALLDAANDFQKTNSEKFNGTALSVSSGVLQLISGNSFFTNTSATEIDGITANVRGLVIRLFNNKATAILMKHQSGASSIFVPNQSDFIWGAKTWVELIYDDVSANWNVIIPLVHLVDSVTTKANNNETAINTNDGRLDSIEGGWTLFTPISKTPGTYTAEQYFFKKIGKMCFLNFSFSFSNTETPFSSLNTIFINLPTIITPTSTINFVAAGILVGDSGTQFAPLKLLINASAFQNSLVITNSETSLGADGGGASSEGLSGQIMFEIAP